MGNRIRALRSAQGITQQELADKLQVARSTIGNIEQDEKGISVELLVDIANLFSVTTDFILCRSDSPRHNAPDERTLKLLEEKRVKMEELANEIKFLANQMSKSKEV